MKIYISVITIGALSGAAAQETAQETPLQVKAQEDPLETSMFSSFKNLFPEHLHSQMPQILQQMSMPDQGLFAGLADMLDDMMQQTQDMMSQTPMPDTLSGIIPMLSGAHMGFLNGPPPMLDADSSKITVIRIVARPEWVEHVCFPDAVHNCKEHLKQEHETRVCMMDHFKELSPQCKEILSDQPTLVEACYEKIQQFCNNDRYSCEKVMSCMLAHESDISHDQSPTSIKCLPKVINMAHSMGIGFPDSIAKDTARKPLAAPKAPPAKNVVAESVSVKTLPVATTVQAFDSSKLTTNFAADNMGRFEMDNTFYFAGMAGGMVAFVVVGAVIFLQKRREETEDQKYEPILSPDENEYDEYA